MKNQIQSLSIDGSKRRTRRLTRKKREDMNRKHTVLKSQWLLIFLLLRQTVNSESRI